MFRLQNAIFPGLQVLPYAVPWFLTCGYLRLVADNCILCGCYFVVALYIFLILFFFKEIFSLLHLSEVCFGHFSFPANKVRVQTDEEEGQKHFWWQTILSRFAGPWPCFSSGSNLYKLRCGRTKETQRVIRLLLYQRPTFFKNRAFRANQFSLTKGVSAVFFVRSICITWQKSPFFNMFSTAL